MVASGSKAKSVSAWGRALALLLACLVLHLPVAVLANADPTTVVEPTSETVEVTPSVAPTGSALEPIAKAFDAVFIRPFAFLATAVGACLLVPAAILSVADGNDSRQKAVDHFVLQPWDDATRPLGE